VLEPCTGTGCVAVALLRLLDRPHRAASRLREADEAVRADVARLVAAAGGDPTQMTDGDDGGELAELPGERATIVATELVAAAAGLARRNIAAHGLGDRAEVRVGSLYEPLHERDKGRFDLIVSNPPYISDREYAACPPNVKDHEPPTALRGGADGLDVVRPLIAEARQWLRPGGAIALEIQYDQAAAVRSLLERAGFGDVQVRRDLEDHERVVSGVA
jgi:release factor glutamine methyltransferase